MARRLGAKLNEFKMQDNLTGTELCLYYRMPTTKERIEYSNKRIQREGVKIVDNSTETRIDFGKRLLKGVREDDFEVPKGEEGFQPLSSDPRSPFFREDWKDLVEEHAADCLELLSIRVFDTSVQTINPQIPGKPIKPDEPGHPLQD